MWMKIDDGLHAHRKTRAVVKSHESKRRDAAPMGIWVLAGSWAAQNGTDGWVPEDELDRWDEDWAALVARLVRSGYWWPQSRGGEAGYGFNDWHDYNDPADLASKSGTYGNHVRWHVNEKRVVPDCEHCPKEPEDRGDIAPESGGDWGAISGGDSRFTSPPIALPEPEPEPEPGPDPNPGTTLSDQSDEVPDITAPDRFDEFWSTYDNKIGRKKSEVAYRAALKKPGVTDDLLIAAAGEYAAWCRETGTFLKNPLTWLHGEHWTDERAARHERPSRVQEHLSLVQQLAAEEAAHLEIGQRQ
jgi:hypothetical protein